MAVRKPLPLTRPTAIGLAVIAVVCVSVLSSPAAAQQARTQPAGSSVTGQLVDADGQPRNVRGAAVFVTQAESGLPLDAQTARPLDNPAGTAQVPGLLHAITDASGRFRIPDLPPGAYRLVAQSWLGRDSVPTMQDDDSVLLLHGGSDPVSVAEEDVDGVEIRALGAAAATIEMTPEEGNAFLLISLAAPQADPVLGPQFWGPAFVRNIVGVVHTKRGRQVVQGLPQQADVHVMYLNYDNNPGIGGISFRPSGISRVSLPVFATWSNGYHTPPEHLQPAVEWIRGHRAEFAEVLTNGDASAVQSGSGHWDGRRYAAWLEQHGSESRTLDGAGEFTVFELAAAERYLAIRDVHESRSRR